MNVDVSPLFSVNPVVTNNESPVYVCSIVVKSTVTADGTGSVEVNS